MLNQSEDWSYAAGMDSITQAPVATVGAYDAKTHLAELLDRVQRGEQIIITRHGKPIARLIPESGDAVDAAMAAIDGLAALGDSLGRRGIGFTDEQIRAMRDDGRR